jgi:phosphopantetheinyl transferase
MINSIQLIWQSIVIDEIDHEKEHSSSNTNFKLYLLDFNGGLKIGNQNFRERQSDGTRKWMLKKFAIQFSDLSFNSFGKPMIEGFNAFSISHTRNFSAVFLTDSAHSAVGVDIEKSDGMKNDWQGVSKKFFHPSEQEYCHTEHDFIELWTRKEAILKTLGLGLVEEMNCFDCSSEKFLWNHFIGKESSSAQKDIFFNSFKLQDLQLAVASVKPFSALEVIRCEIQL